jgi:hypothetical protein
MADDTLTVGVTSADPRVGSQVLYRHEHPVMHNVRDVPAVVVRVWGPEMVNLRVLFDGYNDIPSYKPEDDWKTSVHFSEEEKPYSWHWGYADLVSTLESTTN